MKHQQMKPPTKKFWLHRILPISYINIISSQKKKDKHIAYTHRYTGFPVEHGHLLTWKLVYNQTYLLLESNSIESKYRARFLAIKMLLLSF